MKKIFLAFTMLFCLCLSLCGCDFTATTDTEQSKTPATTTEPIQQVGEPVCSCEYTVLGYTVTITGTLKNVGTKTYTYVSITYTLYDADGYNVGTALANMNYLGAGETWKYEATSLKWFDEPPASYKCSDITYF